MSNYFKECEKDKSCLYGKYFVKDVELKVAEANKNWKPNSTSTTNILPSAS